METAVELLTPPPWEGHTPGTDNFNWSPFKPSVSRERGVMKMTRYVYFIHNKIHIYWTGLFCSAKHFTYIPYFTSEKHSLVCIIIAICLFR